jgi:hypothetical protein
MVEESPEVPKLAGNSRLGRAEPAATPKFTLSFQAGGSNSRTEQNFFEASPRTLPRFFSAPWIFRPIFPASAQRISPFSEFRPTCVSPDSWVCPAVTNPLRDAWARPAEPDVLAYVPMKG